jgi:hypothetical protein
MRKRSQIVITEARLRKIIEEELVRDYLIKEGMWDDVKGGVQKLSAYVSKQFKQVAAQWAAAISEKISLFSKMPDGLKKVMGVLKTAMSESGESFNLDEGLQAAKELGKFNKEAALSAAQEDLMGPVHDKAARAQKQKNEMKQQFAATLILSEALNASEQRVLKEDFGVTAAAGLGLAVLGGLPMIFKGLHKLAVMLGATRVASMLEKAEKVTHHFEQKVITNIIPDKMAFLVYKGLWNMGIKLTKTKEPYNEIEIKAEKDGVEAIKKAKGLIYKVILIYFAWNGIQGVLHAGASLLGFVEGGATAIKGIELAKGAAEVAKLARAV